LKKTPIEKNRMASKTTALYVGLFIITLFGAASVIWPNRSTSLTQILGAVVGLVSAYIGLQVVNNGVRGKFFNPELYDSENGEADKNENH